MPRVHASNSSAEVQSSFWKMALCKKTQKEMPVLGPAPARPHCWLWGHRAQSRTTFQRQQILHSGQSSLNVIMQLFRMHIQFTLWGKIKRHSLKRTQWKPFLPFFVRRLCAPRASSFRWPLAGIGPWASWGAKVPPNPRAITDTTGLQQHSKQELLPAASGRGPACTQEINYLTVGLTNFKTQFFCLFGKEGAGLSMQ